LLYQSYNNIGCDNEEEVDSDDMEYTEDAIDNRRRYFYLPIMGPRGA
jgi:hypothetical protein